MTATATKAVFDKYEAMGAYHWRECDRRSKVYNPPLVARYELLLSRAPSGRILDIGAGDGYLTGRLAGRCQEVIGLEYEPSGVELAKEMLAPFANASVRQGDAYHLPFEARTFDAITMADVIEHLDRPQEALAEMGRVVADDGVVLITTPHWRSDRVWDERHVKEFTAEELTALVGERFGSVELVFAWPRIWSDLYRTPVGWRALRLAGRLGINPFRHEADSPRSHCQMLAIGRNPRRPARG